MEFMLEAFFSGCISKVINDGKDYSWKKIKSVITDRHDQNISTKIYRLIEKTLNVVTNNAYKNSDDLYDAIERIFNEFKNNSDTLKSVKCGLNVLGTDISDQRCENFLNRFYEGIRRDDDLYKAVNMILQQKGIRINQKEFKQLNETVEYEFDQLNRKVDKIDEKISIRNKNDNEENLQGQESVKSRTREYLEKWNANMFLNDFNKRDENVGVNVKLSEVYLDKHLPHYIWKDNKEENHDLKDLLSEYINLKVKNKMLLILGHPGIGKSTLITWIVANFINYVNNILVYQFASDLKNIEWQDTSKNYNLADDIVMKLGLSYNYLDGKILIIDGFDEISVGNRKVILDKLYWQFINNRELNNFLLVVTCREHYVESLNEIKSDYITLQAWDREQIHSFCKVYQEITKVRISHNTISNLIENKNIFGIPLILYMVLGLNISIENEYSIVGVYDKIFSLDDGGIYARCLQNKRYDTPHRINEIKNQIHQISREIAIWMFENDPEDACIPQEEYEKICNQIMKGNVYEKNDFKIGNFFKLIRHCEGAETDKLYFVHRSIYEYFVAETIFSSIKDAMIELTEESQKEFAGKISNYLKKGRITDTISKYLQFKIIKFYDIFCGKKWNIFYQWWESSVEKMIGNGMFYYTGGNIQQYKNIIDKEIICFLNLVKILRKVFVLKIGNGEYMLENADKEQLEKYIRFGLVKCRMQERHGADIFSLDKISLEGMNLSGADVKMADLQNANLKGANLSNIDLSGKNLLGLDLRGTNLRNTNLQNANMKWADLIGANLDCANLQNTIFDESQVYYLKDKYSLDNSKVYVFDEKRVISYKSYCERIKD